MPGNQGVILGHQIRGKLGSLEVGRFLAASTVAFAHSLQFLNGRAIAPTQQLFGGIDAPGALGVQYFFVLSGFVMMSAHFQDFGKFASVPKFWWRRICRIYPTYWVALLIPVYFLYGLMSPTYTYQLFSLEPKTVAEFIAPAWSLRYEIAFYIMFGLCLTPYIGKPLLLIWIFVVIGMWGPVGSITHFLISLPGPKLGVMIATSHFVSFFEFYFFAGLLGGIAYKKMTPCLWYARAAVVSGSIIFILCLPSINWGRDYGSPLTLSIVGLSISMIILGLAWMESLGTIRFGRTSSFLGAMSYPLYLLHSPLSLLCDKYFPRPLSKVSLYVWLFIFLIITYVVTAIVTYLFDQPVQKMLRRISSFV